MNEPTKARATELPEDLAAEYVSALGAGEPVDEAQFLARLARDEDRATFRECVEGARAAERGLPRPLAAGTHVDGRYRILTEIGSGGMGRVFAAFDEELRRKVAIKVLSPLYAGDPAREEMLMRESRLLAALSHPGIVAVHESGRDGELSFLVMDLVDGVSLADVIDRARGVLAQSGDDHPRDGALLERAIEKPVSAGRASLIDARNWYTTVARVVHEIARTLEAAHGAQVVHRDLKPGNVMLLGGGTPVLLDFGLAGHLEALAAGTVTQGLYGSVAYLAPEQARTQHAGIDPRTDVYQLGLILYELLTLRRTFAGHGVASVLAKIQAADFLPPRKHDKAIPRDLEAICMMALELDPAKRYAHAGELRADLERYLGGRDVPVARKGSRMRALVRRARHTLRRHPVTWSIVGMGVVAVVAAELARRGPAFESNSFISIDPATAQEQMLPPQGGQIERGRWFVFQRDAAKPSFLWVLSVYGHGDARFVAPCRGADSKNLDRGRADSGPWQLEVGAGFHRILCAETRPQDTSEFEGVVVLASAAPRPELEEWMSDLDLWMREDYSDGVPFESAMSSLRRQFETERGKPQRGVPLTDEERANVLRSLDRGVPTTGRRFIDLPNVEEYEIECRVAGR